MDAGGRATQEQLPRTRSLFVRGENAFIPKGHKFRLSGQAAQLSFNPIFDGKTFATINIYE
jgi:hypothetical protein